MRHDKLIIRSNGKPGRSGVKRRRFNVIDRAVQKARWEIMAQEDVDMFKVSNSIFVIEESGNK